MIEESEIYKAASNYQAMENGAPRSEETFMDGAKWMQNKFIDRLWHDASEEPKRMKDIIAISKKEKVYTFRYHALSAIQKSFHDCNIERWCYLSDILPKSKEL